jgi:hypothetical protein
MCGWSGQVASPYQRRRHGQREAGQRADDRHQELGRGLLGLTAQVRDAAEDEQRDRLRGQPARLGHERVGQFVDQHRHEEQQRGDRRQQPVLELTQGETELGKAKDRQ